MSTHSNWFEVDRAGLRELVADRDSSFILFELVQNALDEPGVSTVRVEVERESQDTVKVSVEDDAPEGFADLRHAFTLFAHTRKRGNVEQRGRFNLGEKLVLSLAESAEIVTTRGTILFDKRGRQEVRSSAAQRAAGSIVKLTFKGRFVRRQQLLDAAARIIAPPTIAVFVNGTPLKQRAIVREFEVTLPTVLESDGVLRRTERITRVRLYDPLPGEQASIYEMGLPIVETGDRWHVDIAQKVPLNQDRDNVTPAYLQRVRAAVLNATYTDITKADANAAWVRDAIEREDVAPEAVVKAVELRFGQKRVIYDPSDREANKLATVEGYTVIPGGALSAASWENVRRAGAALPAGKVTPSPKAYSTDPSAPPVTVLKRSEWTPGMKRVVDYATLLGARLLGRNISVRVVSTTNRFAACWGNEELDLNVKRLGRAWFESSLEYIDRLLLHEFAHHIEADHLSSEYHEAICTLGAKLVKLARNDRKMFRKFEVAGDVENPPEHTAREPLAVEEEARA